jgi:trigger factor
VAITKEITQLEKSRVKLTVTVDKDEVRTQYDALLTKYSKTLQIPGFRKGKVPKNILERKFGDVLTGETLGTIIENSVGGIFEDETFPRENRPLPYSTPEVEDKPALALGKDLNFSVTYDVLPRITVGAWKGLTVEAPDVSVNDEDISRELEAIRERNAIVQDKDEDAAAEKNDIVTIDYAELSPSGETEPGTGREDFVFTLGSGYNMYKIDDEIVGMKKDETRDIEKTYPADFPETVLAGATKKIRITLKALKKKTLPDLEDDFAQDVDEKFKTLEDLKNSVRDRLTRDLDRRLREIKLDALLEKIMEHTPVEIPESMVRVELDSRWRNLARQFNTSPEDLMKIIGASGRSYEDVLEEWRPNAVRALHSRLIVETLMEDLRLEVSEEETEKEMQSMAEATGSSLEDVKKYYEQEQAKFYLQENIKERKLFDMLLAENIVNKGKKERYLDLIEHNHSHNHHDHHDHG